ncbi:MAG: KilA-N domain-containing protein [Rhizobiales bacterium]|nr:KilA-N domain-containing protein [Hyphomicrobiales bacterium]
MNDLKIRGRSIRSDENGLICLTDIWDAAGFKVNQKPGQWQRLDSTQKLFSALLERIVGKSHNSKKISVKSIYYSKGAAGTYAHPVLACAYAGYLSPKLEVEVREVWLRYRAGDATLADDILERAGPAANEWAGVRALTRSTRNKHTAVLADHGVVRPLDFATITNETYIALFDRPAKALRSERGLKKSDNLRDRMTLPELTYIMAAESLANERIEETNPNGSTQCQIAVRKSASFIRDAIEKDRADRRAR